LKRYRCLIATVGPDQVQAEPGGDQILELPAGQALGELAFRMSRPRRPGRGAYHWRRGAVRAGRAAARVDQRLMLGHRGLGPRGLQPSPVKFSVGTDVPGRGQVAGPQRGLCGRAVQDPLRQSQPLGIVGPVTDTGAVGCATAACKVVVVRKHAAPGPRTRENGNTSSAMCSMRGCVAAWGGSSP